MSDNRATRVSEFIREYDLTSTDGIRGRLALIKNMYRDRYSGLIESIPGYRRLVTTDEKIYSLCLTSFNRERCVIYHKGKELRVISTDTGKDCLIQNIADRQSRIFSLGGRCLIADGEGLYSYDGIMTSLISRDEFLVNCSAAILFDGRLFIASGNRIYYSSKLGEGEALISPEDFITAEGQVFGLVSDGDHLWVSDKYGLLCYGREYGYPLLRRIVGIRPTGQAVMIDGRLLLLTPDGPIVIDNCQRPCDAEIKRLYNKALSLFSKEDMENAYLCSFEGYAAICIGSRILLLDLADVKGECFLISEVGSYKGDRRIYRYSPVAEKGFSTHREPHSPAASEVMSIITRDKKTVYYTEENERLYSVYPTEERGGGELCPAEKFACGEGLLCFSTEVGIMLFNNDMRGAHKDGLTTDGNDEISARRIPPSYYSFDAHAVEYSILTEYDDAGLPFTEKSSSGESLTFRLICESSISLSVSVMTDRGEASRQMAALPHVRNGNGRSRIIKLNERANGWLEKRLAVRTEGFCAPFAICSIAFKFQQRKN
jgi:hypothetical protein